MDRFQTARLGHTPGNLSAGDAANQIISKQDFSQAIAEITQWKNYLPTPLISLKSLAKELDLERIDYKHEGSRFGLGSFKALGGAYAALRVLQRELSGKLGQQVTMSQIRAGKYRDICRQFTLTCATDGNHGRSLAWGCQRFGAPCIIYIHAEVSENRAQAMRDFGASVIRIDGDYDASVARARNDADKNGWFVVSDTSWPGYTQPPRDVMAGYGVMTSEVCKQLDQAPTHVFLQGGVGGLAASLAAGFRQNWGNDCPRVIIVEPELAACLFESARVGKAKSVAIAQETIMAGLSCGEPSPMAWEILAQEAADFLTIPDTIVAPTMRLLARPLGDDVVVEAGESAVAGLAALIAARNNTEICTELGLNRNSRLLLIGSEGITDPSIFATIMAE